MKISLAIPTFNRANLTIESFSKVLSNEYIDEIIIVDDHSSDEEFIKLFNLIYSLPETKIKLSRNKHNLGPLMNKYEAVKKCSNDWVILLDSDNIIDNDYIDTILAIKEKNENTLYCPERLLSADKKDQWVYAEFNHLTITKKNVKNYLDQGSFEAFLNTGNYFFFRKRYLQVNEQSEKDPLLMINDALYFSFLWLMDGNKMKIVPLLSYIHRIHRESWYKTNNAKCRYATQVIRNLINAF